MNETKGSLVCLPLLWRRGNSYQQENRVNACYKENKVKTQVKDKEEDNVEVI